MHNAYIIERPDNNGRTLMCTAVSGNLWRPEQTTISICKGREKVRKQQQQLRKKCWKVKRKQVCFSIKNELYTKHEKLYRGHVVGHKFAKPN